MSKATSRFLSRLAWRAIWLGIYAAAGGVLLFFALTRTEVGRDGVRRQIEATFNEQYAGTLEIGSLQGTLLNDLIATDLVLRSPEGDPVATVDSAYAEPYWSDLLTSSLSVQSIALVDPHVRLHRDSTGTWNATRALTRRTPTTGSTSLDLSFANISVQNGRITTTRDGAAPAAVDDRWLFDYTRSELEDLDAEGTFRWTQDSRMVDLRSLSFSLPKQDVRIASAHGRAARARSKWTLEEVGLNLGNTEVRAEGTVQPASDPEKWGMIDLEVSNSRLDNDEVRRLVPRLPVQDVVTVDGRLGGSLDRFVVNQLTLAHDRSAITVEGTAFGLPDSLDVEAQVRTSTLSPADVRQVWPHGSLTHLDTLDGLDITATVQGTVHWQDLDRPMFDLASSFAAENGEGAVRGSLDVHRSPAEALSYSGVVRTDSLNLAPIVGRASLASRVTGRLRVKGAGSTLESQETEIDLALAPSRIGSRTISDAQLTATTEGRSVQGDLTLRQPDGGRLSLRGDLDATGPTPFYDLDGLAESIDLKGLYPRFPSTSLNATLTAQGRGIKGSSIVLTSALEVDSSVVIHDGTPVSLPPHQVSLEVADPSAETPRLRLNGTVASLTLDGDVLRPSLWPSGRLWIASLRHAAEHALRPPSDSAAVTRSILQTDSLRQRIAQASPTGARQGPLQINGSLRVHRTDILRRWWQGAPRRADDLRAETRLAIGSDTLDVSGSFTADRLEVGTRRVDSVRTSYALSSPHSENPVGTLSANLSVAADTLHVGGRSLVSPAVTATVDHKQGRVEAEADGLGRTGPFRIRSDLALRAGRAEFRIDDLYVGAGQHAWLSTSPGTVTVDRNAIQFDSLRIDSPRPLTDRTQRLQVHGTISEAPADTLYAEMEDVLLYPIAQLAGMSKPLGGEMNGSVALTGGWSRPQVSSSVSVRRLSFDRRVLGDLNLRSRIAATTPDLFVRAALQPSATSLDSLTGPTLVPQGPRTVEQSQLAMNGRVQLPGWFEEESTATSDQLDLTAKVDRADLFFFKYIFDETLAKADGYTSGSIHIGGRFRSPIFDANLAINNAHFTLPQFGLSYRATGPVRVDREGIHLQDLQVTDKEGSATVRGSVLFNNYEYFSFDLSAELDELTIIDVEDAQDLPFYGDIRASGAASLTGPLPNATLTSEYARTTPESELYIPVSEGGVDRGTGYIIFADSTGRVPDLDDYTRRENILSDRPVGETSFLEGLNIDINVLAPEESTVHLVFDPVVGDVVTAIGSGRVQLQRGEGDFFVYGNFNVSDGTYLFTAGEVFVRRFNIREGTITWDGPPTNAQLDLNAEYRTRASPAGLPGYDGNEGRIPLNVLLDIGGRVETPQVDLSLSRVRDERENLVGSETLDAILNQPARRTEYATSVLLTNTFLLTTESFTQGASTSPDGSSSGSLTTAGGQLAFNSVSQLVASQLNRYLESALPNVDLNLGFQGGRGGDELRDLDVIYGVALRLLNERLVIRGEGVYTGSDPEQRQPQGAQGEFVVEVRLSNRVSVEAFYRRSGDELTQGETITSSRGAGLSYQAEFPSWKALFTRIFGWLVPSDDSSDESPESDPQRVARESNAVPADSTSGEGTSNQND